MNRRIDDEVFIHHHGRNRVGRRRPCRRVQDVDGRTGNEGALAQSWWYLLGECDTDGHGSTGTNTIWTTRAASIRRSKRRSGIVMRRSQRGFTLID